jgi:tetratricopeptide (TPR) repeat protein
MNATWHMVLALLVFSVGGVCHTAATPEQCQELRQHGRTQHAHACFQALVGQSDPYLRAEGFWGLEMFEDANHSFRLAVAQKPGDANVRIRWGLLLHERFNNTEAEKLFQEARTRAPTNAQAYLGLALVSADGFNNQALEYASKALELDPKLVKAHELMANLALEDSDAKQAAAQSDAALGISLDALDAMAVQATIEILADRSPESWLTKMHEINPSYGGGYALIAHHLVLNRRYEDGVAYYRKAIQADSRLWSARSELGINLMRLGQEAESRQQLELCYANGYRNAATVNSLRLLDSYQNFLAIRDGNIILKLHKKEAELLRPYFAEQLRRAIASYETKYKMKLPGPVQVEVYPDHEDFAVRTLGMPGLGALGVTFGQVVAMDSPSAREPGSFHWASTLWHEMSHVFILMATNDRVPRWFTEGLAVHEESEASPEWGERLTPDVVTALRDKKLLPVSELDRGFVRPQYAAQVIVSYYQAGAICDYIKGRWGDDKLLEMVHGFASRMTTSEVVQQALGMTPESFDKQFQLWLDERVGSTVANFETWTKRLRQLASMAKSEQYDAVLQQGDKVLQMYPEYVGPANAYSFLAEADLAKGDKPAATAILAEYQRVGGHDPEALHKLASLEEELGRLAESAATLERLIYVYPEDEPLHHRLGDLWFDQKNYTGAIREYSAVVALGPRDVATAQYNLARAFFAAGEREHAEEHVLASLEAAPAFRPAQKLLLQLEQSKKGQ